MTKTELGQYFRINSLIAISFCCNFGPIKKIRCYNNNKLFKMDYMNYYFNDQLQEIQLVDNNDLN
ncbi:hypothetical protein DERF_003477 [Dermatophagoides farinae]|uniref:Uncharacterized protein n=1 Tax=Dermatophagoides farinae TaxID=6954 RepID=A0A922LDK6_DERFA|nr:hypothetical protein DERF_003477 [Dermatophagoides farinae]